MILPEYYSVPQHNVVIVRCAADASWRVLLEPLEIAHETLPRRRRHNRVGSKQLLLFLNLRLRSSLSLSLGCYFVRPIAEEREKGRNGDSGTQKERATGTTMSTCSVIQHHKILQYHVGPGLIDLEIQVVNLQIPDCY